MLHHPLSLQSRDHYLRQLTAFQDKDPVKILTGMRGCGKSCLLKLMVRHLKEHGVESRQILELNLESAQWTGADAELLYRHVKARAAVGQRTYLFLDEVQRIPVWQVAVSRLRNELDCDIYAAGSSSWILSSEYSAYLAGRYVEIRMYPLSFREFLDFHGCRVGRQPGHAGKVIRQVSWRREKKAGSEPTAEAAEGRLLIREESEPVYSADDFLETYLVFGGMPGIAAVGFEPEKIRTLLDGAYSAIVMREILERERHKGRRQMTDPELLQKVTGFLAGHIGTSVSVTAISHALEEQGAFQDRSRKGKPAVQTIQAYVAALVDPYVFSEAARFDIKSGLALKTLGKYYIGDTGLLGCLLGGIDPAGKAVLENVIYFELLRRRYEVAVGKVGTREISFVARRGAEKLYIQVAENMKKPEERKRALTPLRMIRDNYEKIVIALECDEAFTQDGIKLMPLLEFLLDE